MNSNTKDIAPFNEDGQADGYHERYWNSGNLRYKCNYINGEESGYEEYFNPDGSLSYKCNYINGEESGYEEIFEKNKIEINRYYLI